MIKIHAADVPKLEEALDEFLRDGQTVTSIVVTTPVPDRPLPLPEVPTQ